MKKRFLIVLVIALFVLICVFGLNACTSKKAENIKVTITGIDVYVKDCTNPNFYTFALDKIDGNEEAFTLDDVKVYYTYSNGTKKLLDKEQYTCKPYAKNESGKYEEVNNFFAFLKNGESAESTAGSYKLTFTASYGDLTQDLMIEIKKSAREPITLSVGKIGEAGESSIVDVELEAGQEYYKIEHAQSIFEGNAFCLLTKSTSDLEGSVISYPIIKDDRGYELAENKYEYVLQNQVGSYNGAQFKFMSNAGNYLTPGRYLALAQIEATDFYAVQYSNPIKIEITANELTYGTNTFATFDIEKMFLANSSSLSPTYLLECIQYKDLMVEGEEGVVVPLVQAVGVPLIEKEDASKYMSLKYFSNNTWQQQSLLSLQDFVINVQAHKVGEEYHEVDYRDEKWYKKGSLTEEIPSEEIVFVEYTRLAEFEEGVFVKSPLFLTIDKKKLGSDALENLKGYSNHEATFQYEMTLNKYAISFNPNEDILSNLSYELSKQPEGLSSEEQNDFVSVISNALGDCDARLYSVDYTGIEGLLLPSTYGSYDLTINLINNANVCFVKDDTVIGSSYEYNYSVYGEISAPTSSFAENYIPIEFDSSPLSDVYALAYYIRNVNNYSNVYVYEPEKGEKFNIEELSDSEILKIKQKGERIPGESLERWRFISPYVNSDETRELLLGRSYIIYIETPNGIRYMGSENKHSFYKMFSIKKKPEITIEVYQQYDFNFGVERIEIDLLSYLAINDEDSDALANIIFESIESMAFVDGSLQLWIPTTDMSKILSLEGGTLAYINPEDYDYICIKVIIPESDKYFAFEQEFVIVLSENW